MEQSRGHTARRRDEQEKDETESLSVGQLLDLFQGHHRDNFLETGAEQIRAFFSA